MSIEEKNRYVEEFETEIEAAIVEFESLTPPPSYEVFDYVYDQAHSQLLEQKEELKNRIEAARGNGNA